MSFISHLGGWKGITAGAAGLTGFGALMPAITTAGAVAGVGGDLFNMGMQVYNMRYQQKLQKEVFKREDNATQRRVADLKAAGLSPVLAAGSAAGSGPIVSTVTPQLGGTSIPDKILSVMALLKMKEDISQTVEQSKLIALQQLKTIEDTSVAKEQQSKLRADTSKVLSDKANTDIDTARRLLDYKIQKATGTTSNNNGAVGLFKNAYGISNESDVIKNIKKEADRLKENNYYKENRGGFQEWQRKSIKGRP